ncbi:hypothetical protein BJV78DRAFT_1153047 [Lactifluus subvellereus]|nr:hypothetical protein BJV78DRAFT_1153047 [Lactifluus subvellereus]
MYQDGYRFNRPGNAQIFDAVHKECTDLRALVWTVPCALSDPEVSMDPLLLPCHQRNTSKSDSFAREEFTKVTYFGGENGGGPIDKLRTHEEEDPAVRCPISIVRRSYVGVDRNHVAQANKLDRFGWQPQLASSRRATRSSTDPEPGPVLPLGYLVSLCGGVVVYTTVDVIYHFTTVIDRILRQPDWAWPPLSDPPWTLPAVIRYVWRVAAARCWESPRACIGAFTVFGVLHVLGIWEVERGTECRTTGGFFVFMGVGAALESAFRRLTGRRVGGYISLIVEDYLPYLNDTSWDSESRLGLSLVQDNHHVTFEFRRTQENNIISAVLAMPPKLPTPMLSRQKSPSSVAASVHSFREFGSRSGTLASLTALAGNTTGRTLIPPHPAPHTDPYARALGQDQSTGKREFSAAFGQPTSLLERGERDISVKGGAGSGLWCESGEFELDGWLLRASNVPRHYRDFELPPGSKLLVWLDRPLRTRLSRQRAAPRRSIWTAMRGD